MQNLKPNTLLQGGKYKIVRFISAGGFGCTYEAEHVMLHKPVAIKEFFVKDFCNRDENTSQVTIGITAKTALVNKLKSKFIAEAQSVSVLEHPHIVHVFDVFEENGTAYYVMDYINGLSLSDLLHQQEQLPEQQAVGYVLQIADALQYVHVHNCLHLDIKPGNIMIDSHDKAILIDFGASKQYDEVDGENTSTLIGRTPGFAPLEQMGNDVVKFLPSTDIYALGATLYKLITGVTPPSALLLASGESLGELPSTTSASTRNAILQAMQINKTQRPQSVGQFIALLTDDAPVVTPPEDNENTVKSTRKTAVDPKKETKSQPEHQSTPEEKLLARHYGYKDAGKWRMPSLTIALCLPFLAIFVASTIALGLSIWNYFVYYVENDSYVPDNVDSWFEARGTKTWGTGSSPEAAISEMQCKLLNYYIYPCLPFFLISAIILFYIIKKWWPTVKKYGRISDFADRIEKGTTSRYKIYYKGQKYGLADIYRFRKVTDPIFDQPIEWKDKEHDVFYGTIGNVRHLYSAKTGKPLS